MRQHIKANRMEFVEKSRPLQAGRHDGEREGDAVAIVEMRRFTLQEFERGDADGWRLHAGWFERCSGLRWAWFARDVSQQE